jgi:hypothetical protein
MNDFYVYIYLDPRKPGIYKYGKYKFDYEPFYVGKGKGNRLIDFNHRSGWCKSKLKSLNYKPIIIAKRSKLSVLDAYIFEQRLINTIGRADLNKGPLTNMTDGGEGPINLIKTEQHKKNIAKALMGKKYSVIRCKNISEGLKNLHRKSSHTKETKQKIGLSKLGKKRLPFSDEWKENMSESHKGEKNHFYGKHHSKASLEKMSRKLKGRKGTFKNKKHTTETKQKMVNAWILRRNKIKQKEYINE